MTTEEPRNRITKCPECGGKLSFDRNAVTSDNRFIYRARPCEECGAVIHTKQPPEEITWIDVSAKGMATLHQTAPRLTP